MDELKGDVVMTEPQWQRLWEKSAIGTKIQGGGLKLYPEEVIFVHLHRHQPLPRDNWITDNMRSIPDLEDRYFILEALRVPGNLIRLYPSNNCAKGTWALRWHKEKHPDRDEPTSEVRWHRALDQVDIMELFDWTKQVESNSRLPEVLVIDDEGSIVSYELSICDPSSKGRHERTRNTTNPEDLGVKTQFRHRMSDIEKCMIENPSSSIHTTVLSDLIERGLSIRSGFKYGTLWRGYEEKVGTDHAPWLIDTLIEAPINWTQACLNARLSAGVNKKYLVAIEDRDSKIQYLEFRRPPSDRRWTNTRRH